MIESIAPIPLAEILEARSRIAGAAIRTPLVRLETDRAGVEIFLKLENLQPIGSFKIRGAANAMARIPKDELSRGVYTASAGNMAQGVAWNARKLGVRCRVIVPDHAPQTKLSAIERLGGAVVPVPFARWWQTFVDHQFPGEEGRFIHPVADRDVIAGNGTAGLEILEDLPDVDAVIVPFGGGGQSCGIAAALAGCGSAAKVYAAEVETAAPFSASLAAGSPQSVEYTPSFVDGIGGKSMLPEMWPLVRSLLAGSIVVSLAEIASAIRLLVERSHTVAEGAGAASLAAALTDRVPGRRIVCVISGGNIDLAKLAKILNGEMP